MNTPYDILGVAPSADESQLRAAYKKLAAKYYSASDSASLEKMKALDAAYDELIRQRKTGAPEPAATVSEFADVRRLITSCRLSDAEEILDSVRSLARGGEWNYLKALVLFKRGLSSEALVYIKRALEKDDLSSEFNELYDRIGRLSEDNNSPGMFKAIKKLISGMR